MKITARIVGVAQFRARVGQMSREVREALKLELGHLQTNVVAYIQRLLSGELLKNRTNRLRDSVTAGDIVETDHEVYALVGVNTPYAAMQNFGGTIRPRSAKVLTIPLQAVLTANGVPRYTAREIIAEPGAGGFIGTVFLHGMLFGREDGGGLVPLFALRDSVVIQGKHYMERGLTDMRDTIQARLTASVMGALRAGG